MFIIDYLSFDLLKIQGKHRTGTVTRHMGELMCDIGKNSHMSSSVLLFVVCHRLAPQAYIDNSFACALFSCNYLFNFTQLFGLSLNSENM